MSSKQDMFIKSLFYNGIEVVLTVVSGTSCPCAIKYGTYSPEWHTDNPLAEDCNGTLKISSTSTNYTLKGVALNKLEVMNQYTEKFNFIEIGKMTDTEIIFIGSVNTADMTFFNFKTYESDEDVITNNMTITIDSNEFLINHIYDVRGAELYYQIALLRRKP